MLTVPFSKAKQPSPPEVEDPSPLGVLRKGNNKANPPKGNIHPRTCSRRELMMKRGKVTPAIHSPRFTRIKHHEEDNTHP